MENQSSPTLVTDDRLVLQLYVAGMSAKSMDAIENIKKICNELLADNFELEIIDLYKNPEKAAEQHIVFSPSLVKLSPLPKRTLIGSLADSGKVMKVLGITLKK